MKKNFLAILLGCIFSAAIFVTGVFSYEKLQNKPLLRKFIEYRRNNWTVETWELIVDGKVLSKFKTTLNQFGIRKTPLINEENHTKFFTILGGSFAWGYGLADNQTLAFLLGKNLPKYRSFNFATSGGGINRSLDYLNKGKLDLGDFNNREGITLFLLTTQGIQRATGVGDFYLNAKNDGYYEKDRSGNWNSQRKMKEQFPGHYNASTLKRHFEELLEDFSSSDFTYVCELLTELKRRWIGRNPKSDFYVVYYPDTPNLEKMDNCFRDSKVAVLRPEKFDNSDTEESSSLPDGHPSFAMVKHLAKELVGLLP